MTRCHEIAAAVGQERSPSSPRGANRKRRSSATLALASAGLLLASSALATTIYPIDRAAILAGQRFDLKVEFEGVVPADRAKLTINGVDHTALLGRSAQHIEKEPDAEASALLLRDVAIKTPGRYVVEASDGTSTKRVVWEVYGTARERKAKNVILFIGDGLSVGHRTAARLLSKGITEGKYHGELAMDAMPRMALLGTSGVDSVITDSANSAHAYTTGHKSSVNALGVCADRTKDPFDDPRVETLTSLAKRRLNMAVGVVTDAEVQDATPAAMVAHTRRRATKAEITEMFYESGVDVLLGGGSAYFLPQSTAGSKRKDEKNFIELFKGRGFQLATTGTELAGLARNPNTTRVLGLFHPGNMDGVLDRKFLKPDHVQKLPDQPDLVDMTRAALDVLSRSADGFVLMVEAALIDKYSHPLDWERAVMDTIMFDQAVAVAKEFAARNEDTLVLVTADHTHGINVVGTIDDNAKGELMRDKIGLYDKAGYPNYVDADKDGYPDRLDASKRLAVFFNNFPDHYETFRPKLGGAFAPAIKGQDGIYRANEAYKAVPGAVFREGNLPRSASSGVHTADDVLLSATGPGSEQVMGFMDNTELFRVIANALALGE